MKYKIYLAGPIAGLNYDKATDWRNEMTLEVEKLTSNVYCASPMRAKEFLKSIETFKPHGYDMHTLSSSKGVFTRDHWDCMTSDLIVVNVIGAKTISIGTVMEMAWAHAYRKPVILLTEPGNIHDHIMLNQTVGFTASNITEAAELVFAILEAK